MNVLTPAPHRKPGVSYAVTDDGLELPVIDITHPAFALSPTDAELDDLAARFQRDIEQQQKLPRFLQKLFMRAVLRKSLLGRGLLEASGSFLSGTSTYLMKLGPENLASSARRIDRKIAAALPATSMRLRLQNVARLLADALRPALDAAPGRSLHLINIAGGPALDSLNSLILLKRDHPDLLDRRPIAIHVLDLDEAGPLFGARALDALSAPGAPLGGLTISFERIPYDWRDTESLSRVLAGLGLAGAVWAAGSEGGLFEYGSDAEIVGNLSVLRLAAGPGTVVVGTVTRDEGPGKLLPRSGSGLATRPRTLPAFQALAERGGWTLDETLRAPFSFDVRLR